jgi:hypothetical protein
MNKDHFPLLASVSMQGLCMSMAQAKAQYCIFRTTPKLREIRLSDCRLECYILPLGQITQLSLDNVRVGECLSVMANSPLYSCRNTAILLDEKAYALVSRLRSLVVNSERAASTFLDGLKTPALLDLEVEAVGGGGSSSFRVIVTSLHL